MKVLESFTNKLNLMYDKFLSFNDQKTTYTLYKTSRQQQITLPLNSINNVTISRTDVNRYLGVMIDSKPKFTSHIFSIENQLYPYLFVLRNERYLLLTNDWTITILCLRSLALELPQYGVTLLPQTWTSWKSFITRPFGLPFGRNIEQDSKHKSTANH